MVKKVNKVQNNAQNNVQNQQVNNNDCQHVQLGGMAYYDAKQYFLFSPQESGVNKVPRFRSMGVAQQMPDGTFDFVFIDAAKSHYLEFWNAAFEHVECGSVIVCDNILMRGSTASDEYDSSKRRHRTSIRRMRAFLESITNDERCVTSLLASGDGISVSVVR